MRWSRPCAARHAHARGRPPLPRRPVHRPALGRPRREPPTRSRRLVGPARRPPPAGQPLHRRAGGPRADPRRELKDTSDLGEFGAAAIRRGPGRPRHRRPCPRSAPSAASSSDAGPWTAAAASDGPPRRPAGTCPTRPIAARRAGQLRHRRGAGDQGGHVTSRCSTASRCTAAWSASWPMGVVTAKAAVEALLEHWRAVGLPGYAQFDNDTIFQGPHQHKDVIGRVMRACLGLGVVPVFAPPRETGFQATIEEVQRPLAGQGLGAVRPRVARGRAGPVGPLRGRRPAPRRRADRGGPVASRRSPRAGRWTCRPTPAAGWSSCGGRDARGPSRCWAGASRWIRCGPTGWCVPRSTWTRAGSASIALRRREPEHQPLLKSSHINCLEGGSRSDRGMLSLAIAPRLD